MDYKPVETLKKSLETFFGKQRANQLRDNESSDKDFELLKAFHDSSHAFNGRYQSEFINQLITEGDDEFVWQQQMLQLSAVIKARPDFEALTATVRRNPNYEKNESEQLFPDESDSDEDNEVSFKQPLCIKDDSESEQDDGFDSDDSDDSELANIQKRIVQSEDKEKDIFSFNGDDTDSDSDDDALFNGAHDELEEESDENQPEAPKAKTNKKTSEVDDKFFRLAEMEEFLENEESKEEKKAKKAKSGDSDDDESDNEMKDIDMFADWSDEEKDEEESGQNPMYSEFFDPPTRKAGDKSAQEKGDEEGDETIEFEEDENMDEDDDGDDDGDDDDDDDDGDEEMESGQKKVRFSSDTKPSGDEAGTVSEFAKKSERLLSHIRENEEKSLEPKSWQLLGEVEARHRPDSSMLEEHVDFQRSGVTSSEVTEENNENTESIIRQLIKAKAFDDNERQRKPREEAFQVKMQTTVDSEKSKLSLHEVYEQEYLKMIAPEEEETNPLHDEIKKMMGHLFPRLDALASWNYTPHRAVPDIKVKNKMPAIQMEEAIPLTMTTEDVLAPEEIQAKKKGEIKGKTEKTREDKNRERKQKKAQKRQKLKDKEKRLKEVEKQNPGLGNKYSKERALKELEKQAAGSVEIVRDKKKKKSSSKAFFTELQEEVTTQKRAKKTKEKKQKSSDKYML